MFLYAWWPFRASPFRATFGLMHYGDALTCTRFSGELYRGRDQGDDGQEAEYPQHVRNRPRGSRQVDFDRFARVQSWNYCRSQGRRDQVHRYAQGWTGPLYHHQINVSCIFKSFDYFTIVPLTCVTSNVFLFGCIDSNGATISPYAKSSYGIPIKLSIHSYLSALSFDNW